MEGKTSTQSERELPNEISPEDLPPFSEGLILTPDRVTLSENEVGIHGNGTSYIQGDLEIHVGNVQLEQFPLRLEGPYFVVEVHNSDGTAVVEITL